MAPIASLVVRISAQISELQKSFADSTKAVEGFKSSFDRQAAAIQNSIDGISKTFEQFGSVVGTIGVAAVGVGAGLVAIKAGFDGVQAVVSGAVGALSDAVNHTAELGDSLFALSQKTGVSVESLSGFKFVAGQTNTSLDSISGAVFKLEANLGKGAKTTVDALNGIGLSIKDLQAQDPADAFGQIISKLGEIPNASDRAAAGVAIFGKSFKDIAQLTQENLPELIGQAKELGLVMSTETAVAADRFGDAMGTLRGVFEGLQLQIGAKLLPAIVAITETFGGVFIDGIKAATASSAGLGEVFDTLVVQIGQAIGRAIEVLAKMTDAVVLWAAETTKRIADQSRAFLELAPSIVAVGRALDLALSGGGHASAFDALSKNLEAMNKPLEGLSTIATTAGVKLHEVAQSIATGAAAAGQNFGATYTRIQGEISAAADKMRASLKSVGDGGVDGASKASDAFKSFGKQLVELTAQIDRAKANGTPIAELVRLFGDEAAKATPKAHAWGIAVKASVLDVSRAFNQAALDKTLTKLDDQFAKFFSARAEAQFKKLQAAMRESGQAMVEFSKLTVKGQDAIEALGSSLAKKQFEKLSAGLHDDVPRIVSELTNPFRDAFAKLGEDLPGIILHAIQGGGNVFAAAAVGFATVFATSFRSQFNDALKAVSGDFSKLSAKNKALGIAATGLESFTSGFAVGQGLGKGKGALAGAATGAAIGANPALSGSTLGISIAVGAGVGALAGFLGGRSADKKAKEALIENKKALAEQFGGMTKLNELAAKLGVNIQAAFDAKKPAQFQAAVDKLNAAIEEQNKRTEGIAIALEAVNARAATFAKQFSGLVATKASGGDEGVAAAQKIQELAQRTQPEFERLGLFVRDTFAAIVKETGSAIDAISQLAPSFETLKSGITDFGLTSTAVIDSLIGSFDLVNNEAFKPFFSNIQTSGELLKGLGEANALSPETFQAAAADIGQSIQEVINRGADIAKTLALSAPQLQILWEAQQKFGLVTDQTTQSILDQAVAQGVVGEQFKSTQEKVLDVLLAIADVFHADIPDGIRATASAATAAGQEIKSSLGGAVSEVGNQISDGLAAKAAAAGVSIQNSIGGAMNGLVTRSKSTVEDINANLLKITAPDLTVNVDVDLSGLKPLNDVLSDDRFQNFGVPALARGGIVRRPTLALVGERGPEAVIPLNSSMFAPPVAASREVILQIGEREFGRAVLEYGAQEAEVLGLVPR